jgi:hypothetical protein
VVLSANDFYDCSTANVAGIGDQVNWFGQTDSVDPVAGASDLTPTLVSNAKAHGFPGIFENQSFSSFVDIGAVHRRPPDVVINLP